VTRAAEKAPAARLALLGILPGCASPAQTTAEIVEQFKRAGEAAKKTGLVL